MGQITGLTGGAGSDQLQFLVTSNVATSLILAPIALTTWNPDDMVMLVGVSMGPTPSNFTLNSQAYTGNAVLVGGAGDDSLTSGAGNDFILTGGGVDIVKAGNGNDTIILNGVVGAGSSFTGGIGTDTTSVSMIAGTPPTIPPDQYNTVALLSSTLATVEKIQFNSLAGEKLRVSVNSAQAGMFTGLTGGAGSDQYLVIVQSNTTTSFTLGALALTAWGSDDFVLLAGASQGPTPSNFTLNSAAYTGNAVLVGGAGNDSLTSGAGNDFLIIGGGIDTAKGGGGNDTITLNGVVGAGSSFTGGIGTDTIAVSMAAAAAPINPLDLYSTVVLGGSTLATVEAIRFDSQAGENLRVSVVSNQASLFTSVTGGAGSDQYQIVVLSNVGTSFTLTPPTMTNWNANDNITLFALSQGATPSDFTLNSAAYGGTVVLVGGAGNDTMTSGSGNDFLIGGDGVDNMLGSAGNDQLDGQGGNDILRGGNGTDTIVGGSGSDQLTGGPNGDRFVFRDAADSTVALPDLIMDFDAAGGDRIDLSVIDVVAGGADDPFTFLAGGAFDSTPGRVIVVNHAAGQYRVEGDIDGNNVADFAIVVTAPIMPGVGAFIL